MDNVNWIDKGAVNTWLPYAQMKKVALPLEVARTKGSTIYLRNGMQLIDGLSNWWTICHGHSNDYIIDKCIRQIKSFSHISFCGLASDESFRLAHRIANLFDDELNHIFFSDSGSTAVEVAMRMAFQYHKNQCVHSKNRFIFFRDAYHGDTMGCVSVSDSSTIHGNSIKNYVNRNFMFNISDVLLDNFEERIAEISNSVAGLIIEPLLQAAGGMKFYDSKVLIKLREITSKFNIVFIADEVAVGFSRLGFLFASQGAGVIPDVVVLGKSITGGFCTFGVTVVSKFIYESFLLGNLDNVFTYGSTFMANPVACVAGNASLDLFESNNYYIDSINKIESILIAKLSILITIDVVVDVRILGAVGAVELSIPIPLNDFTDMCVELGVWLRPLGNVIYVMPSYTILKSELEKLCNVICVVVKKYNTVI